MKEKNNKYLIFNPSSSIKDFFNIINSLKDNDEVYIVGSIILNKSKEILEYLINNENPNIHCLFGVNEILMFKYIEQVNYLKSDINITEKFIYRERYNVIRHLWLVKHDGHDFLDYNNELINDKIQRNKIYQFLGNHLQKTLIINEENIIITNLTSYVNDIKLSFDSNIEDKFVTNYQDVIKQQEIDEITKGKKFYVIKL